jgi:hypothetical protein
MGLGSWDFLPFQKWLLTKRKENQFPFGCFDDGMSVLMWEVSVKTLPHAAAQPPRQS